MKTVCGAALASIMAFLPEAGAFGLKTHLWVGEQVLQDIKDDCNVSIGGSQTLLPAEVCHSIRTHPGVFLAGSLGPDLYPDLVTGQVTTHPGIERARSADSTSKHMPPAPSSLCASGPAEWKTSDWLRHLYDNASAGPELAFSAGYLVHAASDVFAHTLVNAYAGDTFDLTDDERNVEVRHTVIERYLDARISLNPATIESLQIPETFVRNQLLFGPCVAAQTGQVRAASHVAVMSRRRAEIEQIAREAEQINETASTQAASSARYALYASDAIDVDRQALLAVESRVFNLQALRKAQLSQRLQQQQTYLELKSNFEALSAVTSGGATQDQMQTAQLARGALSMGVSAPTSFSRSLDQVQSGLLKAATDFEPFRATQRDLVKAQVNVAQLTNRLTLNEARHAEAIRMSQQLTQVAIATQELHSETRKWADAMDAAGTAYIQMAHDTGKTLVSGGQPSITAYTDWLKCHGLSFTRVSYRITGKHCAVRAKLQAMQDHLDEMMRQAPGPTSDIYVYVRDLKEILDAYISKTVKTTVLDRLEDASAPTGRLMALLGAPKYATRKRVKSEFATPVKGRKDLIVFDDAAALIDRELQFQAPTWSPELVPAAAHAVALSKMALLDVAGVQTMVGSLGGELTDVPISNTGRRYSVLYQTVRSIDGNHQWQQHGLPYWRKSDAVFPLASACRRYGYGPSDGPGMGFPLFANHKLRTVVFAKVFPTPVYGVLAQHMGGLPGAPDAGTAQNPFPFADDLLLPKPLHPECSQSQAGESMLSH